MADEEPPTAEPPQAPAPTALADYQYEIYLKGTGGKVPEWPLDYHGLKRRAKRQLSLGAYGYVAGAAGSEQTARSNLEAFRRWQIVPRMLRDVSARDLTTELFGASFPAPLLLAPVGVQSIVHPEGELATATARSS
jgi:L-lactate dehydrogenase (cytochrome)